MPSEGAPPRNRIGCGTIEPLFCFIRLGRVLRLFVPPGACARRRVFIVRAPDDPGPEGGMVRSANDTVKKQPKAKSGTDRRKAGKALGAALRDAYDKTLAETVPSEMLDLLKKLD